MAPPLALELVALFLLLSASIIYLVLVRDNDSRSLTSLSTASLDNNAELPPLLLPLTTTHLRLFPRPARHAFRYPLLYFGLPLAQLERGALTRRSGLSGLNVFRYWGTPGERKRWSVTALEATSYLAAEDASKEMDEREDASLAKDISPKSAGHGEHDDRGSGSGPLRRRLVAALSRHLPLGRLSVEDRLGEVFLITMPAFLGLDGINPLSVWFCYEKLPKEASADEGVRKLWTVLLEVHNTFGERHLYVLECGRDEDPQPLGYQHRWTFPRAFHVSPFNSRNGFYTLSLVAPFTTPSTSPRWADLNVSLLLLTPSRTPKLHARLVTTAPTSSKRQRQAIPFTTRAILRETLLKFPLALLMTTPRILWHAGILAFGKKLAMYCRPEPIGEELAASAVPKEAMECMERKEDGSAERWGVVETKAGATPGGLVWKPMSRDERFARDLVVRFIRWRLDQLSDDDGRMVVRIRPSNPQLPTLTLTPSTFSASYPTLTLLPISLQAFTLLLLSPTPTHALRTLASPYPQTLMGVSDPELFLHLFSPPPFPPSPSISPSSKGSALQRLLRAHNPLSPPSVRALAQAHPEHWIETLPPSSEGEGPDEAWRLAKVLGKTVLSEWAEEGLLTRVLRLRFVEQGEGWRGCWRRSGGQEGPE